MWLAYPQFVLVASKTSSRFVLLMAGIGLIILVRPKSVFFLGPRHADPGRTAVRRLADGGAGAGGEAGVGLRGGSP